MASSLSYPITDVHQILQACNASEPLRPGDERWYNFTELRHARVLDRLQKVFSGTPVSGEFHHRVLCGHRGCGKSTELLRFKKWADEEGFLCVRIEVNVRLGQVKLEFSDFFLLAVTTAEEALQELGSPLPKDAIRPIVEWFAEITRVGEETENSELSMETQAQLGAEIPFLGKIFSKFSSGLKAASSHALTVRERMRNYPHELIERTASFLGQVHRQLKELDPPREHGLIFLFDNLDRYDPDEIDRVLIVGSNLLERLECHALYTIPIDLEYNPRSGPLRDAYGQPVMLPMIPLRRANVLWRESVSATPHEEGAVSGMRDALTRRVEIAKVFEDPHDADVLIRMSGGCIRDLMHLITLSYEMSDGDVLSSCGVAEAVRALRATLARQLSQNDYERLATIGARESIPRDEHTLHLLYNRAALEYSNGSGGVWLDVHPLIVEIAEFQDALRRRNKR